jgi:prepilin-type N-terminal cleavage/methylation domain-containing protein
MDRKKGCCGRTSKGFTLIELLVVIAIIGILATIVLVSLNSARSKARDTQRIADVRQLQTALEMYFDSNGSYPAALSDMVTGGQMPAVPLDPSTRIAYGYGRCGTNNTDYTVAADLENTHSVLATDIDTATCTITVGAPTSCADTNFYYCVEP